MLIRILLFSLVRVILRIFTLKDRRRQLIKSIRRTPAPSPKEHPSLAELNEIMDEPRAGFWAARLHRIRHQLNREGN